MAIESTHPRVMDPQERAATALEKIVELLGGIHHELFQLRKSQTGPAATGKKIARPDINAAGSLRGSNGLQSFGR
jgi:hypothetical protein